MVEDWTKERLLDLAAGRQVVFTGRDSAALPVPAWILTDGATSYPVTTGQRMGLTHPDDRQKLIDSWWEASNHPGKLVEVQARLTIRGEWANSHTWKVCLFDHPDVAAMVEFVEFDCEVLPEDFTHVLQAGEYEDTRWLIHTLDESGVIRATEGMVFEITGRYPDEVIGQSVIEHLHPDGFDDALLSWMDLQNGPPGTTRTARQRVLRPDGTTIWVESTTIKRVGPDGESMTTALVHDLTDRRRQESALRASQQEFRLLADQVPSAVFRADADQRITFRNQRWRDDLDRNGPVDRLVDVVHPDHRALHERKLMGLATGAHDATATYEVRGADGERVLAISCRSVLDLVNERRSYVGAVTDITDTVRLRERAERDGLTGLYNRATTEEHLQRALAADPDGTRVVFVDLDGFKAVNDTWGHEAGDVVLRELARRLQACVRPTDTVGRFGGDEFVIIVAEAADTSDGAVADRIRTVLDEDICWSEGGRWSPAASIGVARACPGEDVDQLVRRADQEMFTRKRDRRGPVPG